MLHASDVGSFAPLYCLVGLYRLCTDDKIYRPIIKECWYAARRGLLAAIIWGVVSYPLTRIFIRHFGSAFRYSEESRSLGINVVTYATLLLVLDVCSASESFVLNYFLSRKLRVARKHAYQATVASRGKTEDFWIPYVEEWSQPPLGRAERAAQKSKFHERINNRWVRMIIMRTLLLPLSFVPFLGLTISAFLKSLTLGKRLHQPYFKSKSMNDFQQELFIVERQYEYRSFGFVAALLERMPIIGLWFTISNEIGAAMWAHALEKQQHAYASGERVPTRKYVSKTAALPPSDVPEDFVGSFPTTKGPITIKPVAETGTQ